MARELPGWVRTTGWVVLGVAAVGLPVSLTVAALDAARRTATGGTRGLVVAGLVVLAVALVVGAERGLVLLAREVSASAAAYAALAVASLVGAGVLLPALGLVLAGIGVVVGLLLLVAALGLLAWWRWRTGPRPEPRPAPSTAEVRSAAEARRVAVRDRHARTREAVARGLIGPGYTRGR